MITITEIEKLAVLSRIKLDEEDKENLVSEFDSILGYIDQLKKVEVSLEAENRIGSVKNVMREDIVENTPELDRENLLNEAPNRQGDFITVKKIIAQD